MVLVFSRIDLSRNFEEYITVDYVVDRSLERAVKLWRYVESVYCMSLGDSVVRFAKPNLCVWGGHI